MRSRVLAIAALMLVSPTAVAVAGPVGPTAQAADGETCQGKPPTIVQTSGTVKGTNGDDVIIAITADWPTRTTTVIAGAGDDIVCAVGSWTPTLVDGGRGVDSIVLIDNDFDGLLTVRDFEHLKLKTFFNLGEVHLEWTHVPSELSGTVVGDYNPGDPKYGASRALVLDNPTVYLVAPEASGSLLMVDLRREHVSLGEGLGFKMIGFNDVGATAPKVRFFGDNDRNYAFLSGCDVAARGGGGNDRLWMQNRKVDQNCPGARLYGQNGPDWMIGTKRNDVLIGGPSPRKPPPGQSARDLADGRGGQDRCVAEKEEDCER